MAHARRTWPRMPGYRPVLLTAAAATIAAEATPRVAAAQAAASLQARLAAEDSRTSNSDSLRLLTDALDNPDPALRASAARALGRFERVAFVGALAARAADPEPRVRQEVFNALAQIAHGRAGGAGQAAASVVTEVLDLMIPALRRERDPAVRGVIARSLGRIARNDSTGERVRAVLAGFRGEGGALASPSRVDAADPSELFGVLHGTYSLARTLRPPPGRPGPVPDDVDLRLVRYGQNSTATTAGSETAAEIRRLTMLALNASGARSDSVAMLALDDPDGQVRRLGALAAANIADADRRRLVLTRALADPAFIVRLEAARFWRRLVPSDCGPIVAAAHDRSPAVALAAIDALGTCPATDEITAALAALARPAPRRPDRARGSASWHTHAHAVVALARLNAPAARPIVRSDAEHPVWQVRAYAARAATALRDTATLRRLAGDAKGGVREAAIQGLSTVLGHDADSIFVRALASAEYHVVLTAATALKGTPSRAAVLPALLQALGRLTRTGEDNSRDPRAELLQRVGELGDPSNTADVQRLVRDFDPVIAQRAAEIVSRWTGTAVAPAPARMARVPSDLARIAANSNVELRFTMAPASGGGAFVVRLRTEAAPATAQRLIALARRGYYNGLTFHRVEPTFVIQGGSPGATEYIGDSPFMRDEVDLASHTYGTVGISTRGRDTGDAQIFVNLTDNYRLDHDYTVAGIVIEGMPVVDGILEGDEIRRVTVTRLAAPSGRR